LSNIQLDENSQELRTRILEFAKLFYDQNRTVPSISIIIEKVKGVNRSRFYGLFPQGITELASVAGVPPPPADRTQAVEKALAARKTPQTEAKPLIQLTPAQAMRILGVAQLEGGIDPALVVDRLLDLDTKLRNKHKLSLSKIQAVSDFLDSAVKVGWTLDSILNYITTLWNLSITNLNQTVLTNLISLAKTIDLGFWGSIEKFIKYATEHYAAIANYRAYLTGNITLEQLKKAEGLDA
jgi:hypothetical protein